jgi:hypothetical protein
VVDGQGASDVFPTVILEAMSAARPVVSTRLAGIPELVIHEETGLLARPGDATALADALERLMRDPVIRLRYGQAGRGRMEKHFRVEETVAPLLRLLPSVAPREPAARHATHQIAYLIDRWPDEDLPLLQRELHEMERRNISIVPFVCELNSAAHFTRATEQWAARLEFLPDAMAIEAEWRVNRTLTQKLEQERANEDERAPAAIFLRQARFALALRKLLGEKEISHLHATSSRALLCALILREIVDVTVSATIEPRPELPQSWIKSALRRCEGGRLSDRRLMPRRDSSFLFDKATRFSLPKKTIWRLEEKIGINLTKDASFWHEWSELLARWIRESAERKPKTSS